MMATFEAGTVEWLTFKELTWRSQNHKSLVLKGELDRQVDSQVDRVFSNL